MRGVGGWGGAGGCGIVALPSGGAWGEERTWLQHPTVDPRCGDHTSGSPEPSLSHSSLAPTSLALPAAPQAHILPTHSCLPQEPGPLTWEAIWRWGGLEPPSQGGGRQACRGLELSLRPTPPPPAPSLAKEPMRTLPEAPSAQELALGTLGPSGYEPRVFQSPQLSQPPGGATGKGALQLRVDAVSLTFPFRIQLGRTNKRHR